jgi:hypothetical protein
MLSQRSRCRPLLILLPRRAPLPRRMKGQVPRLDRNLRARIGQSGSEKALPAAMGVILQLGIRRNRPSGRRWKCPIGRLSSHQFGARSPDPPMFPPIPLLLPRVRPISMHHRRCRAFRGIFRVRGPRADCRHRFQRRRLAGRGCGRVLPGRHCPHRRRSHRLGRYKMIRDSGPMFASINYQSVRRPPLSSDRNR